MRSSSLLLVPALLMVIGMVTEAGSEIPQVMSYQGKVTDSAGTPAADGTYTMRFKVYDDATAGTLKWDSGDRSVQVTGGVFTVLLGESPQPAISLPFDENYWLLVTVDGDDQTPRQPFGSVGYAFMASGLVPGTEISGSVTTGTTAALKAVNEATIGYNYGLFGQSDATDGTGVYGKAAATAGSTYGGRFLSASTTGTGVSGKAIALNGTTYGGWFRSASTSGTGVYGYAAATTGLTYGVYGENDSSSGEGVHGEATATTGTNYGIAGRSASTDGTGVFGWAYSSTGVNYGGRFQTSSTSGRGVYGIATASTGTTYGVYGHSNAVSGNGVVGYATATTGITNGVYGQSNSASGRGISGYASATTGITYGVHGESASTDGHGVWGWATASTGDTYGVYGRIDSPDGTGVFGYAVGNGYGVHGHSSSTGVRGTSQGTPSNTGVYGKADTYGGHFVTDYPTGYGVYGHSTATAFGYGVYGRSDATLGGHGVYGWNDATDSGYGVYGRSDATQGGWGVYYEGGLAGSGTKSCVVKTSQGPTLLYCQESPENWFEDFGEGSFADGEAAVRLDPLFLETVTIDSNYPMKVFIAPNENIGAWWIDKGIDSFTVKAPQAEEGARFDYRVVAKRKGFETKRLDYCRAAERDTYLYPELRETEQHELEKRKARSNTREVGLPKLMD